MTLEVRRYERGDQAAWDAAVAGSRSAHFLFERGYMDYHAGRFEDHSLLVYDGSALVAALPANIDGDQLQSHAGLTFGGFLTDDRLSTRRMLDVLAATCGYLRRQGVKALRYKAVPHIYHGVPAEEDLYALHHAGATLIRRDVSSAIRLDSRVRYSKGRSAAVRAASRSGIHVGESRNYQAFMELQRHVLVRHGVEPVHSGEELSLLADRFPDQIKLHSATIDRRLVGGVVVYETPYVAHAQYIAVSEEGRHAHALDAIIDSLLQSCEGRARWWDFGTSPGDSPGGLNESLIRNKETYGARAVVYDQYLLRVAD